LRRIERAALAPILLANQELMAGQHRKFCLCRAVCRLRLPLGLLGRKLNHPAPASLAREVGRADAEACDSSTMPVCGTAREAVAPTIDLRLSSGNFSETLADMSVGAMTSAITDCSLWFPAGVYRLGSFVVWFIVLVAGPSATRRRSLMTGRWSALASAKLVASCRLSARSTTCRPTPCDDGGPKCITKAVITSGGNRRPPAVSTSWGQTSPSLRLLPPSGIMGTHGL
jgi:hypothetical protein